MKNNYQIVDEIENLMNLSFNSLKELNHENFEEKFSLSYTSLDKARILRKKMVENLITQDLRNRLKKVNLLAKLIEKQFDNVVGNHKAEINSIALAIKQINQQKKIASYTRG